MQEIKDIDIRTRKILSVTENFQKIYIAQKIGGRGLRSCQSLFESRIIALEQHLHHNKERNQILNFVYNEEHNNIIQVGDELPQKCPKQRTTEKHRQKVYKSRHKPPS